MQVQCELVHPWEIINDNKTVQSILEAFGDDNKKNILTTISEPCVISDIINTCSLSRTSGYRKIKELINAGMLVTCGFTLANNERKIEKYVSVFEGIKIGIKKNKTTIKVQFAKNYLDGLPLGMFRKKGQTSKTVLLI